MTNILKPIFTSDVTAIGLKAAEVSRDPDVQISALMVALISVCKSLGVGRQFVLRAMTEKWDEVPALFIKLPGKRIN